MQRRQANVTSAHGIHARPAAKIALTASRFRSSVRLVYNGRAADARSFLAVALLCVSVGGTILIETSGPDELEAANSLVRLIEGDFGQRA